MMKLGPTSFCELAPAGYTTNLVEQYFDFGCYCRYCSINNHLNFSSYHSFDYWWRLGHLWKIRMQQFTFMVLLHLAVFSAPIFQLILLSIGDMLEKESRLGPAASLMLQVYNTLVITPKSIIASAYILCLPNQNYSACVY